MWSHRTTIQFDAWSICQCPRCALYSGCAFLKFTTHIATLATISLLHGKFRYRVAPILLINPNLCASFVFVSFPPCFSREGTGNKHFTIYYVPCVLCVALQLLILPAYLRNTLPWVVRWCPSGTLAMACFGQPSAHDKPGPEMAHKWLRDHQTMWWQMPTESRPHR